MNEIPKLLFALSALAFPPWTIYLLLVLEGLVFNVPILILTGAYSAVSTLLLGVAILLLLGTRISKRVSLLPAETKYRGWLWFYGIFQVFTGIDLIAASFVFVIAVRSIPTLPLLESIFVYSAFLAVSLGFILINIFPRLILLNVFDRSNSLFNLNSQHGVSSFSILAKSFFREEKEQGLGHLYSALATAKGLLSNRGLHSNELERSLVAIRVMRRYHIGVPYFPLFRLSSALSDVSRIEEISSCLKDFLTFLSWPLDFEVSSRRRIKFWSPEVMIPLLVGLGAVFATILVPVYQPLFPQPGLVTSILTGALAQSSVFLIAMNLYFVYILHAPIEQLMMVSWVSPRDLSRDL